MSPKNPKFAKQPKSKPGRQRRPATLDELRELDLSKTTAALEEETGFDLGTSDFRPLFRERALEMQQREREKGVFIGVRPFLRNPNDPAAVARALLDPAFPDSIPADHPKLRRGRAPSSPRPAGLDPFPRRPKPKPANSRDAIAGLIAGLRGAAGAAGAAGATSAAGATDAATATGPVAALVPARNPLANVAGLVETLRQAAAGEAPGQPPARPALPNLTPAAPDAALDAVAGRIDRDLPADDPARAGARMGAFLRIARMTARLPRDEAARISAGLRSDNPEAALGFAWYARRLHEANPEAWARLPADVRALADRLVRPHDETRAVDRAIATGQAPALVAQARDDARRAGAEVPVTDEAGDAQAAVRLLAKRLADKLQAADPNAPPGAIDFSATGALVDRPDQEGQDLGIAPVPTPGFVQFAPQIAQFLAALAAAAAALGIQGTREAPGGDDGGPGSGNLFDTIFPHGLIDPFALPGPVQGSRTFFESFLPDGLSGPVILPGPEPEALPEPFQEGLIPPAPPPELEGFPDRPPLPVETIETLEVPEPGEGGPRIFIFVPPPEFLNQTVFTRRGNEQTRAQLEVIRDWFMDENPGWQHRGGGRIRDTGEELAEHRIPGHGGAFLNEEGRPGDSRPGGRFVDLTFFNPATNRYVHIQTVDTDRNGNPTTREIRAAEAIFRGAPRTDEAGNRVMHDVYLIPKSGGRPVRVRPPQGN